MLALPPAPAPGGARGRFPAFRLRASGPETPAAPGQAACRHEEEPAGGEAHPPPHRHSRGKTEPDSGESKFPQTRGILRNRSQPTVLPFCLETWALIKMRLRLTQSDGGVWP